jgi:hypothetical protein
MKYSTQKHCLSTRDIDFSSVEETLLPNGFRVVKRDSNSIEFIGRGMNSIKDDPIRGATGISLCAKAGILHLNANLGGVFFMTLFVCLFPPLLILSLSYFNPANSDVNNYLWIWLIMGPMIAYLSRRRTIKALNRVLVNTISFQSNKK